MPDVVLGINEGELSNLSIEILDYADRIAEILDQIDNKMESLPNYYKGDPCDNLMEYYRDLKLYFPTIKENIVSYSEDLMTVIKKLRENANELVAIFQGFTDDTKTKTKNVV